VGHLHVHLLNSTSSTAVINQIQGFTVAMYGACAASFRPDWRPSNAFKRQCLISHGRGLVNGIKWYNAKLNDASKSRLIRAGLRSLRAAGDSQDGIDLGVMRPSSRSDGIEVKGDGLEGEEDKGIRDVWKAFQALRFE